MAVLSEKSSKVKIDWVNSLFLTLTPILALLAIYINIKSEHFHFADIILFFFFYFAMGLSITAGYHRLFSHRTYEAHPFIRFLYLFFGAGAFQNSALKWCSDHRIHHTFVDSPKDPYNIKRGLLYAHIGWVMLQEEDLKLSHYPRDLEKDPLILWQHRYYLPLAIFSGLILPGLFGLLYRDFWGGFIWGGLVRLVVVQHATFFINSLAHAWGTRPYSLKNSAKDNFFLAFFTYGEGYHNFHHVFQTDYRNGIRWYHFDPTKWLIFTLNKLGLTFNLKTTPAKEILKARLETAMLRVSESPMGNMKYQRP